MKLFPQPLEERLGRNGDFTYTFPTFTTIDRFGNVASGIVNAIDDPSRVTTLGMYTLRGSLFKGCFILGDGVTAAGFSLEWRHLRPNEPGQTFNAYSFASDVRDEGVDSFKLQALHIDTTQSRAVQEVEIPVLTVEEKKQLFTPFVRNALAIIPVNTSEISATI